MATFVPPPWPVVGGGLWQLAHQSADLDKGHRDFAFRAAHQVVAERVVRGRETAAYTVW
jgi:hypothetical protein